MSYQISQKSIMSCFLVLPYVVSFRVVFLACLGLSLGGSSCLVLLCCEEAIGGGREELEVARHDVKEQLTPPHDSRPSTHYTQGSRFVVLTWRRFMILTWRRRYFPWLAYLITVTSSSVTSFVLNLSLGLACHQRRPRSGVDRY